MRTYTQLTREQRYQLSALLKMGHSQTEIAEVIGMHKSTISREIRRNRGQRGYRPKQAHYMAKERRKKPPPRIQIETWELIESKLHAKSWSMKQGEATHREYEEVRQRCRSQCHLIQSSVLWGYQIQMTNYFPCFPPMDIGHLVYSKLTSVQGNLGCAGLSSLLTLELNSAIMIIE